MGSDTGPGVDVQGGVARGIGEQSSGVSISKSVTKAISPLLDEAKEATREAKESAKQAKLAAIFTLAGVIISLIVFIYTDRTTKEWQDSQSRYYADSLKIQNRILSELKQTKKNTAYKNK